NAGGSSIWYRWTAPTADPVMIVTVGSAFNTLLAVYTGGSVSGLTTIASNDDIDGTTTLSRVSFTPVSGSTYQIALDGFNGATGSVTLNWNQAAPPGSPPTANFTANPTSGNAPLTVQFTDQSTGSITSRDWDFGDGSSHSSAQNPSHTYNNAGDYMVTLTVTGSGGSNSKSLTIRVTTPAPPPSGLTADFVAEPTSGNVPLTVRFTDKSGGAPVAAWNWDFGDGSAHNVEQNPTHIYISSGDFAVTLTVTCTRGTTSTRNLTIHVNGSANH